VKSRPPLPEIGRCVWRVLIGNRAGWNPKKANTAIPRPIVDTQLFIIARPLLFTPRIGRKLMPSNPEWLLDALRVQNARLIETLRTSESDFYRLP
jgi:hypothetical protein